ncbi:metallophosphoesterase family protein [Virgibacillus kekensis]|uniref:Phosphoesterase n=1 Tax=Virgibacillus kekensis TaxID=202261 RepID=A0ABV9DKT6_9BACI
MKIVVTADTHTSDGKKPLPFRLKKELDDSDLIIHAGDWNSMEVYYELAEYAEVRGVYGNVDDEEIRKKFPEREIVEVAGCRIGIVHGHGEKKTTEKRAIEAFDGEKIDVLIFGHSHIPMMRYFKKILLFNPGSPTDKRRLPCYSFGILEIGEEITAKFIYFK